jgi:dTDP-4-amino-4,6-dideoxygalactose transaminase
MEIPLASPDIGGRERSYVQDVLDSGDIKGDGEFGANCEQLIEAEFGAERALMTSSCTHALEMAALLLEIDDGDEVIIPSYTFPSTATAFALRGAEISFCEVRSSTLNLDPNALSNIISEDTVAVVPVHYAGVGCEMDRILQIAHDHDAAVVEDAAQAVNATYQGAYLGTIADIGCYSFHGTKSYVGGEGGTLLLNDPSLIERAEIIRQKGTNYAKFRRGEIEEYTWVDVGSSYVPSELQSALVYAQLQRRDELRTARQQVWNKYHRSFAELEADEIVCRPRIPDGRESNYHIYFLLADSNTERNRLESFLRDHEINAASHYRPLHNSEMGQTYGYDTGDLPRTEQLAGRVLRLPLSTQLSETDTDRIIDAVEAFYE